MPPYTKSQIASANDTDIAKYLQSRGIELKRVSNQFLWQDQNVWIRGSEWYSHYELTGGHAVGFVMKYFGLPFTDAVRELSGETPLFSSPPDSPRASPGPLLPKRFKNTFRVFMYLRNARCISPDVINTFIKLGLLYEDEKYHCCVFVGRDENGHAGHVHRRSVYSDFKQTVEGSRAEYAFHYSGPGNTVFVFEAPIDMLAYITMHPDGWQENSYVALYSVSEKALMHQLKTHPELSKIVLCLDSDAAGRSASERLKITVFNL